MTRVDDDLVRWKSLYDAVGRRVASTDRLNAGAACGSVPAVTRHVYAGLETLEEHVSCDGGTNFTLAREFVWGDRFPEPVAMVTHGGVAGGVGGPAARIRLARREGRSDWRVAGTDLSSG